MNYLNFIGDFDVNALKQSDKFYINKNLLNFNKDILSKWYFMENQKDNNISDIVFEKVLLNVDDITFQCLCEESTIYLKEFKSPQITKVVDSVFKNNLDKIDFSFDEEEDEIDENENIFIDVDSLKKDLINIEVMSGSTMQEAQSCIDASVEDLKRLSSYPKHEPRSVPVSYFLKALNNIDTEVNQQLMTEIHKELNKEMKTPEGVAAEDVVNTINTMAEIKDVEDESIKLDLFTKESFNKLVNEFEDNNNDVIKDFLKKNKNIDIVQKKTLAKASLFLENMDELYQTFPHFENVIQHIENFMILQDKGDKSFYIPPLLLGGGPGVGKTFFCNTISKLVNTPFELFNMESMTANWVLTGSSSQWRDATPGKIFRTLMNKDNLTINPIFLLDELEKSGGDSRFGVMNSLLPLLERYTAKRFKDECIPLEIDASYIVWFATANDLDKLTPPIKSRFDIFSVPNPNPTQRKSLIKGIYSAVRTNNTWGSYFNENLPDESLDILANLMAPGAARDLRKSITMACSKAIKTNSNIILPEHIERYDNGEIMPWDIVV